MKNPKPISVVFILVIIFSAVVVINSLYSKHNGNSDNGSISTDVPGTDTKPSTTPLIDPQTYDVYGYYSTYTKIAYPFDYDPNRDPKPATIICPQFTILQGSNPLIAQYEKKYRDSGWKYLDAQGYTIFSIDIQNLPENQKSILTDSSSTSPVHTFIKQAPPGESGCEMTCCHGFIDIVSVTK